MHRYINTPSSNKNKNKHKISAKVQKQKYIIIYEVNKQLNEG